MKLRTAPKLLLGLTAVVFSIWWTSPQDLQALGILKRGFGRVDTSLSNQENTLPAVWPRGTAYTFPDTAESLFYSSSSVNTGLEGLSLEVLDANWQKATIELDRGDLPTASAVIAKIGTGTYRRVNSVRVVGDTTNNDTIYILASRSIIGGGDGTPSNATHVRAVVPPRTGRDAQMVYTVPEGKSARILMAVVQPGFTDADSRGAPDSTFFEAFIRVREPGGAFQTVDSRQVEGRAYDIRDIQFVYPEYPAIPSRSDVMVAIAVTSTASFLNATGSILIDEQ